MCPLQNYKRCEAKVNDFCVRTTYALTSAVPAAMRAAAARAAAAASAASTIAFHFTRFAFMFTARCVSSGISSAMPNHSGAHTKSMKPSYDDPSQTAVAGVVVVECVCVC